MSRAGAVSWTPDIRNGHWPRWSNYLLDSPISTRTAMVDSPFERLLRCAAFSLRRAVGN